MSEKWFIVTISDSDLNSVSILNLLGANLVTLPGHEVVGL